jgi:hypothetical protein
MMTLLALLSGSHLVQQQQQKIVSKSCLQGWYLQAACPGLIKEHSWRNNYSPPTLLTVCHGRLAGLLHSVHILHQLLALQKKISSNNLMMPASMLLIQTNNKP